MTWSEAADLLETVLEEASRLVDGDDVPDMPELPDLGELDPAEAPDSEAISRIGGLLLDVDEAMTALALRRAEIQQEIGHIEKLRSAGAGYLRH